MIEKIKYQLWKFGRAISENLSSEQNRTIVLVPVLFAIGIGIYFGLDNEPNYWVTLGLFEAFLVLFFLFRYKENLHWIFIGILIIFAGFIDAQMQSVYQNKKVEKIAETSTYLKGEISEFSLSAKGKVRILLDKAADFDKPLNGKFRITTIAKSKQFEIGDCVEMAATIFPASLPAVKNGYRLDRKYFFEGLSAIGYAKSEIFKISCENKSSLPAKSKINSVRQNIVEYVNKMMPADAAGVVNAVLVGEKTYIPQKISDNYRNSGLAHFLSVSGLHLGTISLLVFFVVRFLAALFPKFTVMYDTKKFAAVAAIIFSFIYLLISGRAVPAERAFIMTAVVFIGIIYERQAISMRMLSIAALVVLVLQPYALVSVSFQMSFAAVTALIAFYEKYAGKIAAISARSSVFGKCVLYLAGIVICDFVASVATAPFALYHFHKTALYTGITNLLSGPIIAFFLMPVILLSLVLLPFGIGFYPLKLLEKGVDILNLITAKISSLPHSVLCVDSLNFWGLVLIVAGGLWICIWQQKWRRWGILPIIIGVVTMFFHTEPDMVVAYGGQGITARDNNGKMIELPLAKTDGWTRKIWQENLQMIVPSGQQKKQLKEICSGKTENKNWIDLQCDAEKCTYKNAVELRKNGEILLDGKILDVKKGAYIYLENGKHHFEPLINGNGKRIWEN